MSLRILVVEPRAEIREPLEVLLAEAGYEASCAPDAQGAQALLRRVQPEVCIWSALDPENLDRALRCVQRRAPTVMAIAHA